MQRLFVGCQDTAHITIIPVLGYSRKRGSIAHEAAPETAASIADHAANWSDKRPGQGGEVQNHDSSGGNLGVEQTF
jgi:hypothetical protein